MLEHYISVLKLVKEVGGWGKKNRFTEETSVKRFRELIKDSLKHPWEGRQGCWGTKIIYYYFYTVYLKLSTLFLFKNTIQY